ncbi:DUF6207 family protein [Streptomyces sp. NBC_01465]|uniref:DUF6207 family protein n=1 Tax=Streptomyces sp. NBC_01465 TaxID=2903878 RepID=UPI002E350ED3|nr:DUF6207 family protein [Streptomyces sp. NBC_01465]
MSPRPAYLSQPGLARITVQSADEETTLAVAWSLVSGRNLTGPSAPYRVPGEEGVWAYLYGDASPLPPETEEGAE